MARASCNIGVRGVQYSVFDIRAFEREPGKWRAAVRRTNGMPLKGGRKRLVEYVTDSDATSKADAMQMAMVAIDADFFWSRSKKQNAPYERFWRIVAAHPL